MPSLINFNGTLQRDESVCVSVHNRGLLYGDALFETIRSSGGDLLFWEDHYLRLMASMRVLRMEIPMTFTPDFLRDEISRTLEANKLSATGARVRFTVYRKGDGYYHPENNEVQYFISTTALASEGYLFNTNPYEIELYKDHLISRSLISTLKTNNRILNVTGSIFAAGNNYDNCLMLNSEKRVVEALNSNIFLVKEKQIKTPPIDEGCINGIMRKQILKIGADLGDYKMTEASISPFELQQADEIFLTNSITGIQAVRKYRKKHFNIAVSRLLFGRLQLWARGSINSVPDSREH